MKNILLIVNPVSGKMKAKNTLFDVIKVLESREDVSVTVQITKERGHATTFAKNAKANGFDTVVCFGGDGTLNETICGLMQEGSKLPLGYIPAGSTNDFATSMKIPGTPKKAAERIINGKPSPIDIGRFNQDHYFTYVAAFGIFTAISYNVPQEVKNLLGHTAYILGSVKEIKNIRGYKATITADGLTTKGEYIFGAIANSTSVAGIVKLNEHLVDFNDGLFEIGLVKKPKNLMDLNNIISSLATSTFDNTSVDLYKASNITITADEDLDWTLDGEHINGGKTVNIEILNNAIDFIR